MNGRTRYYVAGGAAGLALLVGVFLVLTSVRNRPEETRAQKPSSSATLARPSSRDANEGAPAEQKSDSAPPGAEVAPAAREANSPDVSVAAELEEPKGQSPAPKTPPKKGRVPSRYAAVTSLDELSGILDEWRAWGGYHRAGDDTCLDLLASARRLAGIRDENWPLANWYLAQLLCDLGQFREAVAVCQALLAETEIPVDRALRLEALFRMGLIEYDKPRATWNSDDPRMRGPERYQAVSQPDRNSWEVAQELFTQIVDETTPDERLHELAQLFVEASGAYAKRFAELRPWELPHADVLRDPVLTFRTSVVLAQDLYEMGLKDSEKSRILRQEEFLTSPAFTDYLGSLSLDDLRFWTTQALWELHDSRNHAAVVSMAEPLVAGSAVWEDRDSYLHTQYYLAYSYSRLGDTVKLNALVERLSREGFAFEEMEPTLRVFFLLSTRPHTPANSLMRFPVD
jgi:tetratricopeptide (TPR) repeat protein